MVVKINGQQVGGVGRAYCASQAAVNQVSGNKGVRLASAAVAAVSTLLSSIPAHAASAAIAVGGAGQPAAFPIHNMVIKVGGFGLFLGAILWFTKREWGKRVLFITACGSATFFCGETLIALFSLGCMHLNNWLSQAIESARAAGVH